MAPVRTCVIFNPAAKGNKARQFRRHLDAFAAASVLKLTRAGGHARQLAAEAVGEGFDTIVAAGGDGTLNEVVNGIGDAAGFERARLGVLPLGTMNVFARELEIPLRVERAWGTIQAGQERLIDLGGVEFCAGGARVRRSFVQLAGAGLDARAVELVEWGLKKRIGPLAYVLAGLRALAGRQSVIQIEGGPRLSTGELVLIGNGRLYGGSFEIFRGAALADGLLEARVFRQVNWRTLACCAPGLVLRGRLPEAVAEQFQSASLKLTSDPPAPLELDGEFVGHLPATFSVQRSRLRVVVPPGAQS